MNTSEVISLIEACSKGRVRQFELGELKLSFEVKDDPKAVFHQADPKVVQDNFERNEVKIRLEQLEELKLRDPLMYEEVVALVGHSGD